RKAEEIAECAVAFCGRSGHPVGARQCDFQFATRREARVGQRQLVPFGLAVRPRRLARRSLDQPEEPVARYAVGINLQRVSWLSAERACWISPEAYDVADWVAGHSFLFCLFAMRSSTTVGSARVEVSPREPKSSSAILRRMRRMILAERVLGSAGANWILSGAAIGPISLRTCWISSLRSASEPVSPSTSVT